MLIKKLVGKLDRVLLGGILSRIRKRIILYSNANKGINHKIKQLNYGFDVQYQKYDNSLLNILADKYGSDKGEVSADQNPYKWASHNYVDFYSLAFGLRRNDVKTLIECGLGTNNPTLKSSMGIDGKPGASLRMWRDYFPSAQIIGCDIDSDILFEEERIRTFYCDQTSSDSINTFLKNSEIFKDSIDIIIDDGLHEYHAGICFFENMIEYLRKDGLYIIEDVIHRDIVKYKNYFCENSASFSANFIFLKTPFRPLGGSNNLICITRK